MQAMITITYNDSSSEFIANVRRGVFAKPTSEEMLEYLLPRKRTLRAPAGCVLISLNSFAYLRMTVNTSMLRGLSSKSRGPDG